MKYYTAMIVVSGLFAGFCRGTDGPSSPIIQSLDEKKAEVSQNEGSSETCWLSRLGRLFVEVHAPIKDPAERLAALQNCLVVGAQEPHQLLRNAQFIAGLTGGQRGTLLGILEDFTREFGMSAALIFCSSLASEQDGLRRQLDPILVGGSFLPEDRVQSFLQFLETLESDVLSDHQKLAIEEMCVKLSEYKKIQSTYKEIYMLDFLSLRA